MADGAAWQCEGRGMGARMGQRGSIPAGAEGPRGNLWAGMAFPEVLTMEKESECERKPI